MTQTWWQVDGIGDAGRVSAPATPTARSQLGYVRLWPPRAVDVTLTWGPVAKVHGNGKPGKSGDESAVAPDEEADALARRLALTLQTPPELWLNQADSEDWPHELYPFQKTGIRALLETPHFLLADEMGLGKSVQTAAALRILFHRREIERALVVVPSSLLEQWRRELRKWVPEIVVLSLGGPARERRWQWRYQAHITLVSYEILRSDSAVKGGPLQQSWGAVVLDEAQRIKNPEAEISQVCKALHRVRSIALTGTPLENSTEDLSSILEFVLKRRVTGLGMRSVLGQVQLRRRKSEVLADLPSKTEIELPVPLSHEQRHAYERAEREGVIALKRGTISIESLLALLTRLKQICNFDPVTGVSAKVEDLRGRLREVVDSGQKALVFTQFSGESGANRLAGALGEFQPLVFTGQLSPSQRTAVLDQFNEDEEARVLILSLRAGGQGLNLQAASYVFHFDRWWNPAVEAQAEARAYRIGQERPVFIYRYVSPGTVEEKIAELLEQKAALFDYIVEGVPANLSLGWDRSELLKVIGFRQGE